MTAIQELISFLSHERKVDSVTISVIKKYLPQFIEQEKQQVIDAWTDGYESFQNNDENAPHNYYNQTYKQNSKP